MLWRTKLVWENTEQELLVCVAINLIYEHRALIRPADWQHCEELPTFLCECERQLTCFDCCALFFWELIWWRGIKRKLQSGVKFHCAHRSKKTIIIILHFFFWMIFPPPSGSITWERLHFDCSPDEKEWTVCCCVNEGNYFHMPCLCSLLVLLPHLNVYSLTANSF